MSADDIRKSLIIVESVSDVNARTDEALAPMGLFKTLGLGAMSVFSDTAQGKFDSGMAANKLYARYIQQLGKGGLKPANGTVGTLYTFLANAGIDDDVIMQAITGGINNTKIKIINLNTLKHYWNSEIGGEQVRTRLSRAFDLAVKLQAQQGADELDKEDFERRRAENQSTVRAALAGAAPVATGATTPIAPDTTPDTKDIDAALAQLGVTK